MLWHGARPIGICVFCAPMLNLRPRNRFFGTGGSAGRLALRALNRQLVVLSRVVLQPTYRGAGLAAAFIRCSCQTCPWPWIEALTEMGHLNPFFERAGFVRAGLSSGRHDTRRQYSVLYGGLHRGRSGSRRRRAATVTEETFQKSRFARPVYYVFDNRRAVCDSGGSSGHERSLPKQC